MNTERNVINVLRPFATPEQTPWTVDEAMAGLEPFGEQIVPALIEAIRSGNDDLQLLALQIVREIGPEAKDAAPALIHILRNGDRLLRSVAVTALGEIGPAARETVPLVQQMIEREDDLLRAFAAHSLAQIDSRQRAGALSVLRQLLEREDVGVRLVRAARHQSMVLPRDHGVRQVLPQMVKGPDEQHAPESNHAEADPP